MKKLLYFVAFWLCVGAALAQNDTIQASSAREFVGQTKWVACKVEGFRVAKEEGKPNFLNIGAAYPNHIFTVVTTGDFAKKYGIDMPDLNGKTIYIFGKIELFKDIPQIKNPEKLLLKK